MNSTEEPPAPPASPALACWELGRRLREAREVLDMTGAEVEYAVDIGKNYVSNIEHGRRVVAEDKLAKLVSAYNFTQNERDELFALRSAADARGWWRRYNGILSAELIRYIGYEQGAEEVWTYENALVSGLLQTESYARAVHRGDRANLRTSEVEQRVRVRSRRQNLLTGSNPVRAVIVMNEASLRQQVGGTAVLAEQLQHLLDLVEHYPETLALHILPFTAGSCGAMGGSTFHVLRFPSPRLPALAWQETAISMELVSDQPRVDQYDSSFSDALRCALDPADSAKLVEQALGDLT